MARGSKWGPTPKRPDTWQQPESLTHLARSLDTRLVPYMGLLETSTRNRPNFCPRDFGQALSYQARSALRRMRRRSPLVRSFWHQAKLSL